MEYQTKNHYVYCCRYHIVFCHKYRRKVLINGVDEALKMIIREHTAKNNINLVEMEVMPDHVHLLLECPLDISPVNIVKGIKQTSTYYLYRMYPGLKYELPTLWTRSAFISTVGHASLEVVKRYIAGQKNHVD